MLYKLRKEGCMKIKASDYIVTFLASKGVKIIFGYQGGMITHFVDSIGNSKDVQYVQTYHEQTAAIAAEGYAIESGTIGVACCTSGPGLTNLMTGIADAYFGSIPTIFFSGQVNTYEYKYNKPIRQQGFQEMNVVDLVKPITKYSVLLDDENRIRYELEKAYYIAMNGRKGPVVIDLPLNIQRAMIDPDSQESFIPQEEKKIPFDIDQVVSIIERAKKPMILLGAGALGIENQHVLQNLLSKTQIPVVTSMLGRGAIDETYKYYLGMIGSSGNRCANMSIAKVDVLIALGSRLDTRQTGAKREDFMPNGTIIHVDIDANELEYHRLPNRIKVNTTVKDFCEELLSKNFFINDLSDWHNWILYLKEQYNQEKEIERFITNKAPYRLLQTLNDVIQEGDAITVDIGQNMIWSAQTLKLKKKQSFVTSGGLAPMGFALPVAIGMAFANPNRTIYCITGDGGFHMAIQSLQLIAQYNLKIKVFVINNNALGAITQFQRLYFDGRLYGTAAEGGFINPDYESIVKGYRLRYYKYDETNIKEIERMVDGNYVVDYQMTGLSDSYPKLEYNKPIYMPLPILNEDEYNNVMSLIE